MSISPKQQAFCLALQHQHPYLVKSLDLVWPTSSRTASTFIETIKVESLNRYGNRAGSMRAIISDRIAGGWTDSTLMDLLGREFGYGDYQRKIEFSSNENGRRVPKPTHVQRELLRNLIRELRADYERRGFSTETSTEEISQEVSENEVKQESTETEEIREEVRETAHHPFLAKLREIRQEETRRSDMDGKRSPILESVSGLRPAKNGAKMLQAGIPTEAILHALALDWPQEARSRYGITEYDVTTFDGETPKGSHPAYAYVRKAIDARIPIAAIGPSGTGKSTLFTQIARDMELSYGMIPCNAGVTPSWFVGAYVLDPENPYRSRSAMDMFRDGGILVLEEFDAIDPNIALLANNLIENDVFENPVTGEKIKRHPDFIPVCCMNTRGLGATATNTGRSRLDDATRNRFAIGRFELFLSEDLEEEVFYGILNTEENVEAS